MATTELETSSLRPSDISAQRFELSKRGYEPEEVHRFLHAVADHVGRLQGEIDWQRARVEHLEQRSLAAQDSAYDRISREFMEVVRRADEAATQVRARVEDESRVMLNQSREEANRILAVAAEEAERVLLTARREAERLVAEATRQVERLVHEAGSRAPGDAPREVQAHDARAAREAAMRHHPSWQAHRGDEWTDVAPPASTASEAGPRHSGATTQTSFGYAPSSGVPEPPGDARAASNSRASSPATDSHPGSDSALADFEELNLEFDGSMFDLFGEAGL